MTSTQAGAVETSPAYGLFPADDFRITSGECADCDTIAQALWFFRKETIAVPRPGLPLAGFDPQLRAKEDVRRWNALTPPGSARDYPGLVWVGSPQVIEHARLAAGAGHMQTAAGMSRFSLAPRLTSNRSFYNADSTDFFSRRELRLRGTWDHQDPAGFVARTIWPEDFRIDPAAALKPIAATPSALREFVRGEPRGGAQSAFASQLVWQRDPSAAQQRAGRALIGIMLNGAQGDDDEAHGGHFGLVTGRVGAQGQIHDWLVANFYTLDSESEKGIIAAMLPLDNYLADLNSGQAWYRPSYMLVATLRDERTAVHLGSALARVFNQFYRHQFVYQHAAANCTGISISTLRTIGWDVPALGSISWGKAIVGLPLVAVETGSLSKGKAIFDYFTEDQTRLFPATAFEQAGADLLQIVSGKATRALTPYEEMLRQDVEEIILLRIPQLPSSRAWGDYPVAAIDEYRSRLPHDPAEHQIVPVGPRPFPPDLKDPVAPDLKPLRSDFAVAAYASGLLLFGGWLLRWLLRRRRGKDRPAPEPGNE
ncbi:MAG: hypothetical protein JNM42_08030 [Propionivibrio sp.]|uniref:hypothetical protein n=1 Tax=Propionivibrio sp. TaxID=2212460 RepID=UPI001A48C3BB|nr:hypothetical protein [Propionivibrio sp.]MBL8414370.1 hypothetical protein [Propionivibrio sp.]